MKSLNIINLYQGMSKLKLKINVKVPQLLCIVVSVVLNGGRQIVFCHVIRDQFATFYMSWGLFLRTEFQVQLFDIWKFVSYGKSDLVSKRFGLCFTYCNDSSTSCQDPQSTVDFSIC